MKFSNLFFMCFGHFSLGSQAVPTSKPRCRQQRNIGSMNIHAVVLPSMLQMRLVQQKITKMLDHMLDQLLFPLVLGPSFVSAQNPFSLKSDTLAQGT